MFLHSGASLHGHEYSKHDRRSTSPQHANRRPTLLRSALTSQNTRRRSTQSDGSSPGVLQGRRPISESTARTQGEKVARRGTEQEEELSKNEVGVGEGEQEEDDEESEEEAEVVAPMHADPGSLSGPEGGNLSQSETASTRTTSRRRRKRVSRKGATRYVLAYPAPSFAGRSLVVQKVIPKLYLQLQRVTTAKRPMPTIDVFSSSRIAGPAIAPRVAKRFPRIFGVRGGLGSDDVVLMKCEDYDDGDRHNHHHGTDSEEEEHSSLADQRKLLAVLSPVKKSDLTEIVLDDGSVWVAQPLPNGSFDFVHTDIHGITTTARWVRRAVLGGAGNSSGDSGPQVTTQGSSAASPPDLKYTFSLINPLSRRHPVMATLTQSALEVQSQYTAVSTTSSRYPPGRSRSQTLPSAASHTRSRSSSDQFSSSPSDGPSGTILPPEPESDRATHPIDDATKTLISVTAIWLALRLGWSPYYKPSSHHSHDQANSTPTSSTVASFPPGSPASTPLRTTGRRCTWSRRNSMDECSTLASRAKELPDAANFAGLPKCATVAAGGLCSRDQSPAPSTSTNPPLHNTLPRRATSTGAAFMKRHIQLHSPEVSDTEHIAADAADPGTDAPKKKTRGSRILSGDWAPSLSRIGSGRSKSSSRRPLSLQGRTPSFRAASQEHPASPLSLNGGNPDGQAATITVPKRSAGDGRRVQSAYYMSLPSRLAPHDSDGEAAEQNGSAARGDARNSVLGTAVDSSKAGRRDSSRNKVPEDDSRRGGGVTGRIRSFGNWFRRFGTH